MAEHVPDRHRVEPYFVHMSILEAAGANAARMATTYARARKDRRTARENELLAFLDESLGAVSGVEAAYLEVMAYWRHEVNPHSEAGQRVLERFYQAFRDVRANAHRLQLRVGWNDPVRKAYDAVLKLSVRMHQLVLGFETDRSYYPDADPDNEALADMIARRDDEDDEIRRHFPDAVAGVVNAGNTRVGL